MNCWKTNLPSPSELQDDAVLMENERGIPKAIKLMNQVKSSVFSSSQISIFPTTITTLLRKSFLALSAAPQSWIVT